MRFHQTLTLAFVATFLCVTFVASTSAAPSTDSFGTGSNQFNIDFVTIPGSPGDGFGGQVADDALLPDPYTTSNIPRDYRIGVFEITNDQWNKFEAELGLSVGVASSTTAANLPVGSKNWFAAAQFVNWLNTSKGYQPAYKFTGTQGTPTYTLDTWSPAEAEGGTNLYRHKDAFYYLPTEDEWLKAAYWDGSILQLLASNPGDPWTGWNFDSTGPWEVGSSTEELNGTYDMMGNLWEWTESPYSDANFSPTAFRSVRGGSYATDFTTIFSNFRNFTHPVTDFGSVGFRVAAEIPEPTSLALLGLGGLALLRRTRGCV
jgi:formylglycine-generating enzyme required for sulfatase activity